MKIRFHISTILAVLAICGCALAWAVDHYHQRVLVSQLKEQANNISADVAWATYWSTRSEVINEIGRNYRSELDDYTIALLCESIVELYRHRKWIDEIDADVMHPNPALETAHQTLEILDCSSLEGYISIAENHLSYGLFPELDPDNSSTHGEFAAFIRNALKTEHGQSVADRLEIEMFGPK